MDGRSRLSLRQPLADTHLTLVTLRSRHGRATSTNHVTLASICTPLYSFLHIILAFPAEVPVLDHPQFAH